MSRKNRQSRRKGCRRNRRNQSGGEGMAYRFGGSVDPTNPSLGNAAEVIRFPSCEEATRPGYIEPAQIKGGLPGFAGGRRSDALAFFKGGRRSDALAFLKGGRRSDALKQMGGRYTNEFEVVGPSKIALMDASYSGCGDGLVAQQNPLNKGDITSLITAPPPLVPTPTPAMQKGGKCGCRVQSGGVGGVDSMVYEAPRSGYTHEPSNSAGGNAGTLADGKTPFLVNVPYSAQPTPSAACLKTGGGRKSRKAKRKASRKNRKANRKTRRN